MIFNYSVGSIYTFRCFKYSITFKVILSGEALFSIHPINKLQK